MSDRSSFITEFIHCDRCLEAAKRVLMAPNEVLRCAQQLMDVERGTLLPVIVGMTKTTLRGGALIEMDRLTLELHPLLCHPLRIAVLDEWGQQILIVGNGADLTKASEDGHRMTVPRDFAVPKWDEAGKVHDWKNHVSDEVQAMWHTFTLDQQAALARQAQEAASREEWG